MITPSNNLPGQLTRCIGRERDVVVVTQILADARLVVLTGPGGIGKTRLALEVAAARQATFADGVCFVDLSPLRDPALVPSAIAQVRGVQEGAGRSLFDNLTAHLTEKALLLVLDNFEQVAAAAPMLAALLAACAQLTLLVTSREALHLYGEHDYPVPPLALPDPHTPAPPEPLTQYAAVRLFVERARAASPDFALTPENAPLVAAICARLDGLPLAIELAAARVRLFPPPAMLARLEQRLALLTGGPRNAPPRHQALRNAIGWSYDLLTSAERELFRRMAVFAGGARLETIAAVCLAPAGAGASNDPLPLVESLLDKSLLIPSKSPTQAGRPPAEPRFGLLETIREYALEQLAASGEGAQLRQRHADTFLALAEQAEPLLRGPDQIDWLQRLDQEHDNLRAALAWYRDSGAEEQGLRLAGALWWFWHVHAYLTEGREQLAAVLASAPTAPIRLRAQVLGAAGWLALAQSDLAPAVEALEQSLALSRQVDDAAGLAEAARGLGQAHYQQGDFARAMELLEASARYSRSIGDQNRTAQALFNLAQVAGRRGDYTRALAHMQESLTLFRAQGDTHGLALALGGLGWLALLQGDFAAARPLYEESLLFRRALGNRRGIAVALSNLGEVARGQGDYAAARALYEEALAMLREVGFKRSIAIQLHNLGHVALQDQQYPQAAALFGEALALNHSLGDRAHVGWCLAGLAEVAAAGGQFARAARLCGTAEALLQAEGAGLEPADRLVYERTRAGIHAELGAAGFAAALEDGGAMPLEQAIRYARQAAPGAAERPAAPARSNAAGSAPPLPPTMGSRGAASSHAGLDALTPREREVLRLVARGLTDADVAAQLFLSPRTVQSHLYAIYRKLDVPTRGAASRYALDHHLI